MTSTGGWHRAFTNGQSTVVSGDYEVRGFTVRSMLVNRSGHRIELNVTSQLDGVLNAENRFSKVRVVVECKKALFVTINGHIETESALLALRDRVLRECPGVARAFLHWRVTVDESGKTYNDRDSTIFGDANKA